MGMTADLDAAIQAGSTMVRVGTGVFGARTYRLLERDPGRSARQRKAPRSRGAACTSAAFTSRCVTQRRRDWPPYKLLVTRIWCCASQAVNAGATSACTSVNRMLVCQGCTVMRPRRTGWLPRHARPDASVCKLAWSSARRRRGAQRVRPAAASTPAPAQCRRPKSCACACPRMKSALPSSSEPTGAPRPLAPGTPRPNQSGCTARALPGTHRCHRRAALAVAALNRRAPSRCSASPRWRASWATSATYSGSTWPPVVFSSTTRRVRAKVQVVGLDGGGDVGQAQCAVGLGFDRLRLDRGPAPPCRPPPSGRCASSAPRWPRHPTGEWLQGDQVGCVPEGRRRCFKPAARLRSCRAFTEGRRQTSSPSGVILNMAPRMAGWAGLRCRCESRAWRILVVYS